ncbi:hypothetical protein Tco_0856348 [Tanacetum coccineum]|uniref:Uncharacterized protein n=1 Tax=Tanacetum coccineum TaxID=301880 RepID=A0ABQ5B334_9ASTR
MVVIDEHHDHDMGESSMCRDPHDMGESSMHLDAQVDNQMVILPEHLQHPGFCCFSFAAVSVMVPDVPEDEKPKKGRFFDNFNDAFEMYQDKDEVDDEDEGDNEDEVDDVVELKTKRNLLRWRR